MNSTCAGGTGAFIDQMSTLLNMSLEEMNEASLNYHRLYPIASRVVCLRKQIFSH